MNRLFVYVGMLVLCAHAHAGYGGMGNVDTDNTTPPSNGFVSIFLWAAVGAAVGYFFCREQNKKGGKQFAPDGGAVIGVFVGAAMPFVWTVLTK